MRILKQYRTLVFVFKPMRLLTMLLVVLSFSAIAQKEKPENYKRFDERLFHFGFMLGANTSSFTLFEKQNAYEDYGLKSIVSKPSIGGQVGIVATMKMGTPVVRLRLLPTLSFQEKILNYTFENPDTTEGDIFKESRVNATNIDIPLMFQFRTLRVNNFAAYVLLGGQYSIDLQSQEDDSQNFNDPFIKTKKHDFHGQVGGGVEFFAPYFKFGMEIKYSHGIGNVFVPENTTIGAPIDRLYNGAWWFSIIFEG